MLQDSNRAAANLARPYLASHSKKKYAVLNSTTNSFLTVGEKLRSFYNQANPSQVLKKKLNRRSQSQSLIQALQQEHTQELSTNNSAQKFRNQEGAKQLGPVYGTRIGQKAHTAKAFERKAETLKQLLQKCQNDFRDSILRHTHENQEASHVENCPRCQSKEQKLNQVPFLEVYKPHVQGINCPTDLDDLEKRFLLTQKMVRVKEYDSNRKISRQREMHDSKMNSAISKAITQSLGQMHLDQLLNEIEAPSDSKDIKISDGDLSKVDTSLQSELRDLKNYNSDMPPPLGDQQLTLLNPDPKPSRKIRNYVRGILSKSRSLRESHSHSQIPELTKSAAKDFVTKFNPKIQGIGRNVFSKSNRINNKVSSQFKPGVSNQEPFFFNSSVKPETRD